MDGSVTWIAEARNEFLRWATWKKLGADVLDDPWAAEINELIASFPEDLRATVEEVYVSGADMKGHMLRLHCPENTIVGRLGRADRLLMDQLMLGKRRITP
jgi:hypothetical protein